MGARSSGAYEVQAEIRGDLPGFGVEVVENLHVIGNKADRRHDDVRCGGSPGE
jgi:hypothetical protein